MGFYVVVLYVVALVALLHGCAAAAPPGEVPQAAGCAGAPRVNVITHSHGGQAVAYAAKFGACFDTVVTVATPVRWDMMPVYQILRGRSRRWIHIHSDRADYVQAFGELFDGHIGVPREMMLADLNVVEPGVAHSALLDSALWTQRGWWALLPTERPVVLVGGTWWMKSPHAWPRPTSTFSTALLASGHTLVNGRRGFGAWSGALDGVPWTSTARRRADWSAAGEALFWYLRANEGRTP